MAKKEDRLFKPVYDDKGVLIASAPNWEPEIGDPASVKTDVRFGPPSREKKETAEYFAEMIMGAGAKGYLAGQCIKADIYAIGSSQIRCKFCGKKSHYTLTHCPKCKLPIFQTQAYHSRVSYGGVWRVLLASDVTRAKKVPKGFTIKKPPNVDEKLWYMFVNLCFVLAPIVYCEVAPTMEQPVKSLTPRGPIDPTTFSVGVFKNNEKLHMKWTVALVRRYQPFLWLDSPPTKKETAPPVSNSILAGIKGRQPTKTETVTVPVSGSMLAGLKNRRS